MSRFLAWAGSWLAGWLLAWFCCGVVLSCLLMPALIDAAIAEGVGFRPWYVSGPIFVLVGVLLGAAVIYLVWFCYEVGARVLAWFGVARA